jgi:hypothetical protein
LGSLLFACASLDPGSAMFYHTSNGKIRGQGKTMRPIAEIAKELQTGAVTSRELVEDALAKIEDPAGEGSRIFIRVFRDAALAAADASPSRTPRRLHAMRRLLPGCAPPAR